MLPADRLVVGKIPVAAAPVAVGTQQTLVADLMYLRQEKCLAEIEKLLAELWVEAALPVVTEVTPLGL